MKSYNKKMSLWISTLTFTGAYMNSMALMKYSIPVSHVTGNWNLSVQGLANFNLYNVLSLFDVILSFFFGTVISGIVFSNKKFIFNKISENYLKGLGIALFITTMALSEQNSFMYIVAIITGMQNGMFITYRNVTCRTTHLTGLTTELGTQIGMIVNGKADFDRIRFAVVNILMAVFGIVLSVKIYGIFGMKGFYFASFGYFFSSYICKKIRIKYFDQWKEAHGEI